MTERELCIIIGGLKDKDSTTVYYSGDPARLWTVHRKEAAVMPLEKGFDMVVNRVLSMREVSFYNYVIL